MTIPQTGLVLVDVPGGEGGQLQKPLRVDEPVDALARGGLPRDRCRSTDASLPPAATFAVRAELLDERGHALAPPRKELAFALDLRGQEHGFGAYRSCK